MSNFADNYCTKEKIYSIKQSLNEILIELKKILTKTDTVKNIGNKLILINKNIDFLCLQSLGFENPNASYLGNQLRVAATQMSQGGVIGAAKKCIPYVENLINDLENDYEDDEEEDEDEDEDEEDEEDEPSTLFPGHKYLNLSDESEYPEIKAKYKQLSLLYHPDKCPNKNTPGMTKSECEEEFKILDSEYKAIKNRFNKTGGKKSRKTSRKINKKTNKKTSKKHNSKSDRKKVKKTKRRYNK
jgi:hypothetical protein